MALGFQAHVFFFKFGCVFVEGTGGVCGGHEVSKLQCCLIVVDMNEDQFEV